MKRFVTLARARRILGKKSHNLTDDQIEEVLDTLYTLAELVYHEKPPEKKSFPQAKQSTFQGL